MNGITLVKETNPDYVEITPDEAVLKELNTKPQSWIGKELAARPARVAGNLEEIVE